MMENKPLDATVTSASGSTDDTSSTVILSARSLLRSFDPRIVTYICCAGTGLTDISTLQLASFPHLIALDVSNNDLAAIPSSLFQGRKDTRGSQLWSINAANNNLVELPAALASMIPVMGALYVGDNPQLSEAVIIAALTGMIVGDLKLPESASEAVVASALGGCLAMNGRILPVAATDSERRRLEAVQAPLRVASSPWRPRRELLRVLHRRNLREPPPTQEARDFLVCTMVAAESLVGSSGQQYVSNEYDFASTRAFYHQAPLHLQHWTALDKRSRGLFARQFAHCVAATTLCSFIDQTTLAIATAHLIDAELGRASHSNGTDGGTGMADAERQIVGKFAEDVLLWPTYVLEYIALRLCADGNLKYPEKPVDIDVLVLDAILRQLRTEADFEGLVNVSEEFSTRVSHYRKADERRSTVLSAAGDGPDGGLADQSAFRTKLFTRIQQQREEGAASIRTKPEVSFIADKSHHSLVSNRKPMESSLLISCEPSLPLPQEGGSRENPIQAEQTTIAANGGDDDPTALMGSEKVVYRGFAGSDASTMGRVKSHGEKSRRLAQAFKVQRSQHASLCALVHQSPLRMAGPQHHATSIGSLMERAGTPVDHSGDEPPLRDLEHSVDLSAISRHSASGRQRPNHTIITEENVSHSLSRPNSRQQCQSTGQHASQQLRHPAETMTLEEFLRFKGVAPPAAGNQTLIQRALSADTAGSISAESDPITCSVRQRLASLQSSRVMHNTTDPALDREGQPPPSPSRSGLPWTSAHEARVADHMKLCAIDAAPWTARDLLRTAYDCITQLRVAPPTGAPQGTVAAELTRIAMRFIDDCYAQQQARESASEACPATLPPVAALGTLFMPIVKAHFGCPEHRGDEESDTPPPPDATFLTATPLDTTRNDRGGTTPAPFAWPVPNYCADDVSTSTKRPFQSPVPLSTSQRQGHSKIGPNQGVGANVRREPASAVASTHSQVHANIAQAYLDDLRSHQRHDRSRSSGNHWENVSNAVRIVTEDVAMHPFTAAAARTMHDYRSKSVAQENARRRLQTPLQQQTSASPLDPTATAAANTSQACSVSMRGVRRNHPEPDQHQFIPSEIRKELSQQQRQLQFRGTCSNRRYL